MSTSESCKIIKQNDACSLCLEVGHSSASCNKMFRCTTCKSDHNVLLHDSYAGRWWHPWGGSVLLKVRSSCNTDLIITVVKSCVLPAVISVVAFLCGLTLIIVYCYLTVFCISELVYSNHSVSVTQWFVGVLLLCIRKSCKLFIVCLFLILACWFTYYFVLIVDYMFITYWFIFTDRIIKRYDMPPFFSDKTIRYESRHHTNAAW